MRDKKNILFFGDSITEAGVNENGYITQMRRMLDERNGSEDYELTGSGISGNKVYDLFLRMDSDVLSRSPDAVVIFIGVNDIWHKKLLNTGTDADKFERFYLQLIQKLKSKQIAVFLCTPAVIGEKKDGGNEMDKDLDSYSGVIRKLAETQNCPLIDLRKAFNDHLQAHNHGNVESGLLTYDGVHLNGEGNRLVAGKMYEVLKQSGYLP